MSEVTRKGGEHIPPHPVNQSQLLKSDSLSTEVVY